MVTVIALFRFSAWGCSLLHPWSLIKQQRAWNSLGLVFPILAVTSVWEHIMAKTFYLTKCETEKSLRVYWLLSYTLFYLTATYFPQVINTRKHKIFIYLEKPNYSAEKPYYSFIVLAVLQFPFGGPERWFLPLAERGCSSQVHVCWMPCHWEDVNYLFRIQWEIKLRFIQWRLNLSLKAL